MIIKIIKADKPNLWYADHINATYKAQFFLKDFFLANAPIHTCDGPDTWRLVSNDDCVILSEDETEGGDEDGK